MGSCQQWPYSAICDLASYTPEQIAAAEEMAQALLWAASGRRFGVCSFREELRSCGCICPVGCCDGCRLTLSKSPLVSVSEVMLPGATTPLDPAAYTVKWGQLVRIDGFHWPTYAYCASDGLVVTYAAGVAPPAMGQAAMGEMVCGLLAGGIAGCGIPANAVSITRQGVTIEVARATALLGKATNLPIVSSFVAMTNPLGYAVPSKVTSPSEYGPSSVIRSVESVSLPGQAQSELVAFSWREGDPVSKTVLARNGVAHGWMGTYRAQIRSGPTAGAPLVGEFVVTATAVDGDVQLNFLLDAAASALILVGDYYWDAQQIGGPTRLTGTATVLAQVTVTV